VGLCLLPLAAHAVDRALLIGVSDYPALPRRLWLRGPINDVALMRTVLAARGFDATAMRVLVSRAAPSDEPNRANILQAMESLRLATQPGDRVVFYLSGHGSQQPQPPQHGTRPTEPDGLDEVFLPSDVSPWDGQAATAGITNALLDDEIGEWMDALVDRGAKVWAIFDTCHAAGMARGGPTRWRSVDPAELGLPATRRAKTVPVRSAARTDGRTLFFAARTHELTGEEWLPKGAAARQSRIHGVFTYHLAAAWASLGKVDSTELELQIRNRYREEHRASPTPVLQGDPRLQWP
jgi:hypothetical protein